MAIGASANRWGWRVAGGLLLAAAAAAGASWAVVWSGSDVTDAGVPWAAVPLHRYVRCGMWLGGAAAAALAGTLCLSHRLLSGPPSPVERPPRAAEPMGAGWFFAVLAAIVAVAAVQRIPAMNHSFWGDEGWQFSDFVHGKWRPAERGGAVQDGVRFDAASWEQTVFGDRTANNHQLASILQRTVLTAWRKATGHSVAEFDEGVVRTVSLATGLLSLVVLAMFGRSLGASTAGLAAAALMAIHPWHIRFSLEARGYAPMLLAFTGALWMLMRALTTGRTRDWLLFGLLEFAVLYSWKGALYALIFLNAATGIRLLFGRPPLAGSRAAAVRRWLASGFAGAVLFLPLTLPGTLQYRKTIDEIRHRAKPMDAAWARDAVSGILTGIPWHEQDAANPDEVSIVRMARSRPAAIALPAAVGALAALGAWRIARRDRLPALLCLSVFAAAPAAALHFRFLLRIELLTWYLVFTLPALALFLGAAVTPGALAPDRRKRRFARLTAAAAAVALAVTTAPMRRDLQDHPREDLRGAWELTRGAHESPVYTGPSPVYTAWLWRNTRAYDSRADTGVRTAEALQAKMDAARAAGGEFYMIVGFRSLSETICPDLLARLRDPTEFERLGTLWGAESLNTLDVYRMRSASGTDAVAEKPPPPGDSDDDDSAIAQGPE